MNAAKIERREGLINRFSVDWVQCPALKELELLEVGVTHVSGQWCFVRPEPFFGLVITTIDGVGEVFCDGGWKQAGTGSLYTMPPGAVHGYRAGNTNADWKYAWAMFERADKYAELFSETKASLSSAPSYSLEAANRGLFTEVKHGNAPQLTSLWCDLIRASLKNLTCSAVIDPRVKKLWGIVMQNLNADWDVSSLAAEAKIGREQLRRLCQRDYGCSPRQRLTQLRLRKSCEFLLLSDDTLEAIANRIGFSDAFSFSKAFVREYGVPPSAYRVRARSGQTARIMV